jgi:hypothetical protein
MSSVEVPDADAIEQQMPLDDVDTPGDLPTEVDLTEVDPADAVDQHRDVGGDDAEDYPPA